ncbi:hypothetical protein [Halomonas sp. GT]|uniref:hypothetical protein n=1 Tax=Halomonas sp. GT TaxID=1971364 RepID=UPI0009F3C72F|nr:hypothetical protein [Halomonas sp. GT]
MDRKKYLKILNFLNDSYMSTKALKPYELNMSFDDMNTSAFYLQEHGLAEFTGIIESKRAASHVEAVGGDIEQQIYGSITTKGLDYLKEDGGLTSELNVQVIRLDATTIQQLIDAKIIQSTSIPEHEKPALREALKGMKEEGLKQLTTRLISYGLDQGTVTAQQLSQWLTS